MPQFTTKDLEVVTPPTRQNTGMGIFNFTNYYSIFHFGRMPDQIDSKGEAICRMTCDNFLLLQQAGIPNHFIKYVRPNKMEFQLFRILDPDKLEIKKDEANFFIPLQVIFRNSLPKGSSFLKRLRKGEIELHHYGLSSVEPGMKFTDPIIEFTTKLENIDRFIPEEYAQKIAGLSASKMKKLKEITIDVNALITNKAKSIGLDHADGKIEFAIDQSGDLIVVDSIGTPDENRFIYKGVHIGKQILRDNYAKKKLDILVTESARLKIPRSEWKLPDSLPANHLIIISNMYKSLCEAWTNERIWGAPTLDEIVESLENTLV
jgi:phosphoribosylaminoimidazole-succinocarboxamide synthase